MERKVNGKLYIRIACAVSLLLTVFSCHSNLYDEEALKHATDRLSTVDTIDANHTWKLVNHNSLSVDLSDSHSGAQRVQIWSANAVNGENATILGDLFMKDGDVKDINYASLPTQTSVLVALKDTADSYTVQELPIDKSKITFDQPLASKVKVNEELLVRQAFAYCYEDYTEFLSLDPDYDYNDLVLHITMEPLSEKQMKIDVTLDAVGSFDQFAAALRLPGIKYTDIESVTTVDDETFDGTIQKGSWSYIEKKDLLLKSMEDDEAVINLFEDAHWATGVAFTDANGVLNRYKYNVSKLPGGNFEIFSPRTISYIVTVKDPAVLSAISFCSLDPFAIVEDLSGFYELHPSQLENHFVCVLRKYQVSNDVVGMPWVLAIPSGSFRHPLEGINIGFFKSNILFGAYMTRNHSFGEWVSDRKKANDWYNYPTSNQVF